ncbi:Rossmann-fold NAD(P)-binding domain-containing protein [Jatrophihabitans fulvus]
MTTTHPDVLVIGASRGLGLAITAEYLARGARVVATERHAAPGLRDLSGPRLEIEHVDIAEPGQVQQLHDRLAGRSFDLLFVVAGITNNRYETPTDVATEVFERVMVTNALAPMRTVETLRDLVRAGGTIAVMSSGQGSVANNERGGFEIYRASKSALNQLMRSYAARRRDDGHTLLLTAPGWVRTELGGPEAALTVEQSIPRLVDAVDARHGQGGLQFVDYRGETVAW